jgi:NAD(P)-dependent dehydrogenase (short-subunit alcohol dehydrogenase family)
MQSADRFGGDVAVVTGAGSGIGAAIARGLAAEGATVLVVDQHEETARAVRDELVGAGGRADRVVLDVSDGDRVENAFRAMVERHGRIDLLVNNASNGSGDGLATLPRSEWELAVDVTLKGAFLCTQAALSSMLSHRSGRIVNVASVNGLLHLGQEAYSAAKAGLIQLTRSVAVRYGPFGIRANAVAPGTVRTPAWDERLASDPEVFDRLARWYPLGRVGEPEEVAHAVLFLASADASWITGTVLPVDGGLVAGNLPMAEELLPDGAGAPSTDDAR